MTPRLRRTGVRETAFGGVSARGSSASVTGLTTRAGAEPLAWAASRALSRRRSAAAALRTADTAIAGSSRGAVFGRACDWKASQANAAAVPSASKPAAVNAARKPRCRRPPEIVGGGGVGAGRATAGAESASRSADANSAMFAKRLPGFFSSARITTPSSSVGIAASGARSDIG